MIVYKSGDILEDDADWLVNPVNTQGVMGAGLACQFKLRYPKYFLSYKSRCECGALVIGKPNWHHNGVERQIISFPTKDRWSKPSRIEYISTGLNRIVEKHKDILFYRSVDSIAFPKLGCGLGGLYWESQVKPLMEKFAKEVPNIEVRIYA